MKADFRASNGNGRNVPLSGCGRADQWRQAPEEIFRRFPVSSVSWPLNSLLHPP
jgi:hypothetical protein